MGGWWQELHRRPPRDQGRVLARSNAFPLVWCRCFDLYDPRNEAQNLFREAIDLIVEAQYFQDDSNESKSGCSEEEMLKKDEVADDEWKLVERRKSKATRVSSDEKPRSTHTQLRI